MSTSVSELPKLIVELQYDCVNLRTGRNFFRWGEYNLTRRVLKLTAEQVRALKTDDEVQDMVPELECRGPHTVGIVTWVGIEGFDDFLRELDIPDRKNLTDEQWQEVKKKYRR
jgi:hypothetical protein